MNLNPVVQFAAVIMVVFSLSHASRADLMEQFDYTAGQDVNAANSAWSTGFDIVSPGLQHASLDGETGNAAQENQSNRSTISLGATYGDENETVYLSFLARFTSIDNDPFNTIELYNGGTREYAIGLLRNDGNASDEQFEHRDYDLANSSTPDLGVFNTNVNLFVVKFTYTSGGDALTIDAWLIRGGAKEVRIAKPKA